MCHFQVHSLVVSTMSKLHANTGSFKRDKEKNHAKCVEVEKQQRDNRRDIADIRRETSENSKANKISSIYKQYCKTTDSKDNRTISSSNHAKTTVILLWKTHISKG